MRRTAARFVLITMLGGILAGGFLFAGFASGEGAPPTVGVPGQFAFERISVDQGGCGQTLRVNNVGDIDGDGRPDILVAGDSGVFWFDNRTLACHAVASGQYGEGSTIFGRDMNGDGRLDIVTGNRRTRQMVWFENSAAGWEEHVLSPTAYCHNISFADVNGDGRPDMGCADPDHATVSWLEAPADPFATWQQHVLDRNRPVWGAAFADIDHDGRVDLVVGRAWYRHTDGDDWPRFPYTQLTNNARSGDAWFGLHFNDYEYLTVVDLNKDGRPDIVSSLFAGCPEGQVWAFIAPADPTKQAWTAVQLDA